MSDQPVDINLEELRELIKLLRENNVSEFELRKADLRLRIRHGVVVAPQASPADVPMNGRSMAAVVEQTAEVKPPAEEKEPLHEVRSPMVGTFYASSSPGVPPFVEVGTMIRKSQVLCIIEAMKIMNEIESDLEGEIRKVHVTNGQPVEFGEVLFSIKPVA